MGGSYFLENDFHLTVAFSGALYAFDLRHREDATFGLGPNIHLGGGKDWWFGDHAAFGLWGKLSGGLHPDSPRNAIPTLTALVGISVT